MIIKAIKQNLLEGLSHVMRAISGKNANPIFSCIHLIAKDNKLTMITIDNEIRIETKIPVAVEEEGETVIFAKNFYDLVRRLPDVPITMSSVSKDGKDKTTITYNDAEVVMHGFSGQNFPGMEEIKAEPSFQISAAAFHKLIRHTSFTVSPDAVRDIFRGLFFHLKGHELHVVGTDSYRLTILDEKVDNLLGEDKEAIIPIRALNEVDKLLKDDDVLSLRFYHQQAIFDMEDSRLSVPLIRGEYIAYQDTVQKTHKTYFKVDRLRLLDCLDRVMLFSYAHDGTQIVRWQLASGLLKIHGESDYGKVDEIVPVYLEGENVEISFNGRFLMDAIKNLTFETLEITLNGSLGQCIMRPENEDDYLYLLLPTRR